MQYYAIDFYNFNTLTIVRKVKNLIMKELSRPREEKISDN